MKNANEDQATIGALLLGSTPHSLADLFANILQNSRIDVTPKGIIKPAKHEDAKYHTRHLLRKIEAISGCKIGGRTNGRLGFISPIASEERPAYHFNAPAYRQDWTDGKVAPEQLPIFFNKILDGEMT